MEEVFDCFAQERENKTCAIMMHKLVAHAGEDGGELPVFF
jgi:hypothetical protein